MMVKRSESIHSIFEAPKRDAELETAMREIALQVTEDRHGVIEANIHNIALKALDGIAPCGEPPSSPDISLLEYLQELLEHRHWSISVLAKKMNLTWKTVDAIFCGYEPITKEHVQRFAKAFAVDEELMLKMMKPPEVDKNYDRL